VTERAIRLALIADLRRRFPGDRIRNELGLCLGQTRVDVAVINGHLHGYEIKSERDTLVRLDAQVELYGQVLDTATIVTSGKHVDRVVALVPTWWSVIEADEAMRAVALNTRREGHLNPSPDPLSIAQLLWRDEAAEALIERGDAVRSRETRWDLWDRLAELDLPELQRIVRDRLKARREWPGG
jgi:hypothetical protein